MLKKGFKQYLTEANAVIATVSVADAVPHRVALNEHASIPVRRKRCNKLLLLPATYGVS